MGKKSKKQAKFGQNVPAPVKIPRIDAPVEGRPAWRIGRLDFDGPWCPAKMGEEFRDILDRLKGYESMTWPNIEGSDSHFISQSRIIPDAQQRLQHLKLDDVDDLFSLRISGKGRFWGIRQGDAFLALWWDPEHQICPSPKKHT